MNTHTHSISNSKENLAAFDVLIIGGGLAGLCNAIHLSKFGTKVLLIEKNEYPKHKVCGEYISNEVLPYLQLHPWPVKLRSHFGLIMLV